MRPIAPAGRSYGREPPQLPAGAAHAASLSELSAQLCGKASNCTAVGAAWLSKNNHPGCWLLSNAPKPEHKPTPATTPANALSAKSVAAGKSTHTKDAPHAPSATGSTIAKSPATSYVDSVPATNWTARAAAISIAPHDSVTRRIVGGDASAPPTARGSLATKVTAAEVAAGLFDNYKLFVESRCLSMIVLNGLMELR